MADRPDPASPVTRRSFLRASALGAGAAAVPALGVAALAPEAEAAPAGPAAPVQRRRRSRDNWVEPSVWDVSEHGTTPLQLRVEEVNAPTWLHEEAVDGVAAADVTPTTLFTYNGHVPGPTIRMTGDGVLYVQLVNTLSGNNAPWAHRNASRFADPAVIEGVRYEDNVIVPDVVDWKLSRQLIYGPHMQHTTNLHTHGLHVRPGPNPDNGTQSDNVMLHLIPNEDKVNRLAATPPIPLSTGHGTDPQHVEVAGAVDYEFRLGASATNASGGPVPTHPPGTHWYHPHPHGATYDQVVSGMAGFLIVEGDVDEAVARAVADPAYAYRERVMLLQRVFDTGKAPIGDGEVLGNRLGKEKGAVNSVNGQEAGTLGFEMAAGAVERWRVLNGSVDGQGFLAVCVVPQGTPPPSTAAGAAYRATVAAWAATAALPMWHLAFDGVTLVAEDGAYQTPQVTSIELSPANRSDFLFQAPQAAGTYEVWGIGVSERAGSGAPAPLEIATITVTARADAPAPLPEDHFQRALAALDVPEELLPIPDRELAVAGGVRTRQVVYSGWGASGYTCADGERVRVDPETGQQEGGTNSMVISRLKYDPERPVQKMGLGTAEEWVLDNFSLGAPTSPSNSAVAHPFHMHQSPFRVLAVLDPVWTGSAVTGYTARPGYPRWQDVVPIPVNGGRVVFRSRFPNFTGFFVNHCHILQHEDWGMMQAVEVMADEADANYAVHPTPYDVANPAVDPAYPLPDEAAMIDHCRRFHNDDDGTIGAGGVVTGGTWVTFCEPAPAEAVSE